MVNNNRINMDDNFFDALHSKKAQEFKKVAKRWKSGYSMGEIVEIVILNASGEHHCELINTCKKYNIAKYNSNIKYGYLSLTVDQTKGPRSRNTISEVIKKGSTTYKELLTEITIEEKFVKKGIIDSETWMYALSKIKFPQISFYSTNVHIDYVNPSISDYYKETKVSFTSVYIGECCDVYEKWKEMKRNESLSYHHSPYKSVSEYLEDRENGIIYRFSDHWGSCVNCVWLLDGERCQNTFAIGKASLEDFKREIRTLSKFPNQHLIEQSLKNLSTFKSKIEDYQQSSNFLVSNEISNHITEIIDAVNQTCMFINKAEYDKAQNAYDGIEETLKKFIPHTASRLSIY